MAPSKYDISSRVTKITSKSSELKFEEVKIPPPVNDFLSLYKSGSGISEGFSNMFTIDVLPNFVPIIMFCIYHAVSFSPQLELKNHAKVSTATVATYFLAIIYAHILVQDLHLRPQTSFYASEFMDIEYKRSFVNFVLHLPVPTFLDPILKKLFISTTDLRPHIVFCPSANGYSYAHHFGRFAPLSFFTHIHYMASSVQSNSNVNQVFAEYLTMNTLTVNNADTDIARSHYTPANILGIDMKDNTMSAPANKFVQTFLSIFNPVLLRSTQQRQSFAPVYIKPVTMKTPRHNFYDAVFSASPSNLSELQTVFQSVAATFSGVVPCSGDLASVYNTISGTDIIVHGYSDYALPTWINTPAPEDTESYTKRLKFESDDDRAHKINFNQVASLNVSSTKFTYPVCDDTPSHKISLTSELVFISQKTFDPKKPNPPISSAVRYNSALHFQPKVRVLNFGTASSANAYMSTLTGMVIESFEIDSSVVPQPDTRLQIGVENSLFLTSGIPYSKVKPGLDYNKTSFNYALARSIHNQNNPVFASHLVDSSMVIVPEITEEHSGTLVSSNLPGLTSVPDYNWIHASRRFLGGRASLADTTSSNKNMIHPKSIMAESIIMWSPYSYTCPSVDLEDLDTLNEAIAASRQTFFLSNFRTLFGTDVPLTEVSHFLEAMPIA
jgi:hypothetical protein